ncbi:MAG: S41 family peptidase, partial [Bacteroidota bacterium]
MKSILLFLFLFALSFVSFSQNNRAVSNNELSDLVNTMADSLAYYYVSAEDGVKIGQLMKDNFKAGKYQSIKDPDKLAKQLTDDLRSYNGDLHLYLDYTARVRETEEAESSDEESDQNIHGIDQIRFLQNNIAYLKINHFSNWQHASSVRQKYGQLMPILGNSNALIIDVRDNNGGVPYIVSYFISYL